MSPFRNDKSPYYCKFRNNQSRRRRLLESPFPLIFGREAPIYGATEFVHDQLNQISGLHHVTSLAGSAPQNNAFFTGTLGLRRVKKTVNFDAPDVYHLYYGDEVGSARLGDDLFPVSRHRARPARHGRGRRDRVLRA